MLTNTSGKLKIVAYIYFLWSIVSQVYYLVHQYMQLECDPSFLMELVIRFVSSIFMYFILSLVIYGFGSIVNYFERLNARDSTL